MALAPHKLQCYSKLYTTVYTERILLPNVITFAGTLSAPLNFQMNHAAYWVYPDVPWSESNKSTPIKFWLVGLRPGVYILNIGGDRLRVDHVFCGRRRRFSRDVCCGEKERCWRHNSAEKRETNILSSSKYLCWSLNSLHFAWLCTGKSYYFSIYCSCFEIIFVNGYPHCMSDFSSTRGFRK